MLERKKLPKFVLCSRRSHRGATEAKVGPSGQWSHASHPCISFHQNENPFLLSILDSEVFLEGRNSYVTKSENHHLTLIQCLYKNI